MPRTYEIEAEEREHDTVHGRVQQEPEAPRLRGRPIVNTSRYTDEVGWEDDDDDDEEDLDDEDDTEDDDWDDE